MTCSSTVICSVVPTVRWDEFPKFLLPSFLPSLHPPKPYFSFLSYSLLWVKMKCPSPVLWWTLLMRHKTLVPVSLLPLSALQRLSRNLHLLVWAQLHSILCRSHWFPHMFSRWPPMPIKEEETACPVISPIPQGGWLDRLCFLPSLKHNSSVLSHGDSPSSVRENYSLELILLKPCFSSL